MNLSLRQVLLLAAFLIVYGVAVFAVTRAYYSDAGSSAASVPTAASTSRARITERAPLADDPAQLNEQADGFLTERDYPNAIAAYRKLTRLEPENAEIYNDLGLSLHYGGRSGEALVVLQKGIVVDGTNQRIWLTRGFVEYQLGELEAARQSLMRAVELDPESEVAAEARRFLERLP